MLEQQQIKLTKTIMLMYARLEGNKGWEGPPVEKDQEGTPYIHQILHRMGTLDADMENDPQRPEHQYDTVKLFQKMIKLEAEGDAGSMQKVGNSHPWSPQCMSPYSPSQQLLSPQGFSPDIASPQSSTSSVLSPVNSPSMAHSSGQYGSNTGIGSGQFQQINPLQQITPSRTPDEYLPRQEMYLDRSFSFNPNSQWNYPNPYAPPSQTNGNMAGLQAVSSSMYNNSGANPCLPQIVSPIPGAMQYTYTGALGFQDSGPMNVPNYGTMNASIPDRNRRSSLLHGTS